jgi:hypothetical protein
MLAVAAVAAIGVVVDFTVVAFAAALSQVEATAAARSQFEALGVALSQCAAVVTVMAATGIVGATERRRSARRRLARRRLGPTTVAAVAMMPMATGFALATDGAAVGFNAR